MLKWLLVWVVLLFGAVVLWYFGLFDILVQTDHTRISLLILLIFVLTSIHCLLQTIVVSKDLVATRKVAGLIATAGDGALSVENGTILTGQGIALEPGIATRHIANIIARGRHLKGSQLDQTVLLRSLADKLRSREKLGLFVSESLLRLALLGTAIGFILMLIPISGQSAFDADSLRITMSGMTSGMAIALSVTVTGIATALLLKFQYYLLDAAIADLFHQITEVTEVHVIPGLEQVHNVQRA